MKLKTYQTKREAHKAAGNYCDLIPVVSHAAARKAYALSIEAAEALPEYQRRRRVDVMTEAIDRHLATRMRFAIATEAQDYIKSRCVDYLHRHTVNLGTRRYSDYRAEYEVYYTADGIILHGTASATGKKVGTIPTSFLTLVIG